MPSRQSRSARSALVAVGLSLGILAPYMTPADAAGSLPTNTTVSAAPSTAAFGSPVTLTAQVGVLNSNGLFVTPTGAVAFSATNGTTTTALGTAAMPASCTPNSPCTTTLTTTALPYGNDVVTATYQGDSLTQASSGTTTVTVIRPPSAPALSATSQIDAIALSWTTPTDAGGSPVTGYALYRSSSAGSAGAQVYAGSALSFTDSSVVAGTPYYYSVRASNAAGAGAFSAQVTSTALFPPPNAPSLSSLTVGVSSITINWTSPTSRQPITSFKIYRATTSGGYAASLTSVPASATSFVDSGVTHPTHYYYVVSAVSAAGESAKSNELDGIPNPVPTAPAAPGGLTATSLAGAIQLNWTAPADGYSPILGYSVYRGSSAGAQGATPIASGLPSPVYQDTTVGVGTTYYYTVSATNAVGESPRSNEASSAASAYSGPGSYVNTTCGGAQTCGTYTVNGTSGANLVTTATLSPTSTVAPSGPPAGLADLTCPGGSYNACLPAQNSNANVVGMPGDIVRAGYAFESDVPDHTVATVKVLAGYIQLSASCTNGTTPARSIVTVPLPDATYSVENDDHWTPSDQQTAPASYQGRLALPDLCGGTQMKIGKPGKMFLAAKVYSNYTNKLKFKMHYNNAALSLGVSWSSSAYVYAAPLGSAPASAPDGQVTLAISGQSMHGCYIPGSGLDTTFNTTGSADGKKVVTWTQRGSEAAATAQYVAGTPGHAGCLGLGMPWLTSAGVYASYDSVDGLYEGSPMLCSVAASAGLTAQPCTSTDDQTASAAGTYTISYSLPPGDGRISGGSLLPV